MDNKFRKVEQPSEPNTAKTDYLIGAYLYHSWRSISQWRRIPDTPLLGWYDVSKPEVADWQIKWAIEHGISYFAYDWYWQWGKTAHRAGLEAILKSKYIDRIKFCLHQCDEAYMGLTEHGRNKGFIDWAVQWDLEYPRDFYHKFTEADTVRHQEYVAKRFFAHPSYLRLADGRAVFMLYRYNIYLRAYGIAGMRKWLDDFRIIAAKYGVDLFFVAAGSCVDERYLEAVAQSGADAITSYNYPWSGAREVIRYGKKMLIGLYDEMSDEYEQYWQRFSSIGKQLGLKLIVPLCCGFDNSPWSGTVIRSGTTPEKFAKHCQRSLPYFDDELKLGVINAFNEWGESSYCEPSKCWGFKMLEAVRSTFAPSSSQPELEVPINLAPLQVIDEDVEALDPDL